MPRYFKVKYTFEIPSGSRLDALGIFESLDDSDPVKLSSEIKKQLDGQVGELSPTITDIEKIDW